MGKAPASTEVLYERPKGPLERITSIFRQPERTIEEQIMALEKKHEAERTATFKAVVEILQALTSAIGTGSAEELAHDAYLQIAKRLRYGEQPVSLFHEMKQLKQQLEADFGVSLDQAQSISLVADPKMREILLRYYMTYQNYHDVLMASHREQ